MAKDDGSQSRWLERSLAFSALSGWTLSGLLDKLPAGWAMISEPWFRPVLMGVSAALFVVAYVLLSKRAKRADERAERADLERKLAGSRLSAAEAILDADRWAPEHAIAVIATPVQGTSILLYPPGTTLDVQIPLTFFNRSPHPIQVVQLDLKIELFDEVGEIAKWPCQKITGWTALSPGAQPVFRPLKEETVAWPRGPVRLGARVAAKVSGEIVVRGPWGNDRRVAVYTCAFLASQDHRPS